MPTFKYSEAGDTCPLCKRSAICTLRDDNNQKHVRCEYCVEFVITCRAEEILVQQPATILEQYSNQSKRSNNEKLFFIKGPLPDSNELVHIEFRKR